MPDKLLQALELAAEQTRQKKIDMMLSFAASMKNLGHQLSELFADPNALHQLAKGDLANMLRNDGTTLTSAALAIEVMAQWLEDSWQMSKRAPDEPGSAAPIKGDQT